jgi:hypothetical protein
MKNKFFLFFSLICAAQIPLTTSRIIDFNPNLKGAYIGTSERCYFWLHSPDPAHTQIECLAADGTIPKNEIIIPQLPGTVDSWAFLDGTISWKLTNTTFEIVARANGDTTEKSLKGTY